MTGELEILTALIAEDVRHEQEGLVSFMGVNPDGQFDLKELPARSRISIMLFVNVSKIGEINLEATLRYRGEDKWQVQVSVEAVELGTSVIIPIGATIAKFDEPGSLDLFVAKDGNEPSLIKSWPVTVKEAEPDRTAAKHDG